MLIYIYGLLCRKITGVDALASHKRLVALLSFNLKREYYELCDFVRARMSLAIVGSNSLLLRVPRASQEAARAFVWDSDGTVCIMEGVKNRAADAADG